MKTAREYLAEHNPEFTKATEGLDSIPGSLFQQHGVPMVVACTHCQMTMAVFSALIDEDGRCFCGDCAQ